MYSKIIDIVSETAFRMGAELECICKKPAWSSNDVDMAGKILEHMKNAVRILQMVGEKPGGELTDHSIDDQVITVLESMASNADNEYKRERIQQKIDMLKRKE